MLKYPDILDLEAVTLLVGIVKDREILERKVEFFHAIWNVQGYLQRIFIGEPGKTLPGATYAHSGALQDGLEDLEDLLAAYESVPPQASNHQETKDLGTVLLIVSTVLQLLRSLGFIKKERGQKKFGVHGYEGFDEGEAWDFPDENFGEGEDE